MIKQLPARQRIRRLLVLLVFLSFPITMNYLSPYVSLYGSMNGIISASLVLFALMFLSSLFLGRLWCGWICPGSAMGDIAEPINRKPVNIRRIGWIKWVVWSIWIGIVIWMAIQAGGYKSINLLFLTDSGVAVDIPEKYIIYYLVLALFFGLAFIVGKRAGCHTICWMSPFMILGRKLRNLFAWPSLRLKASPDACTDCQTCTRGCPMSLDVNGMVKLNKMENSDCILCGTCIDGCNQKVIRYAFSSGK
jgi:polyferredoxin